MLEGVNIEPILHNAGLKVGKTFDKQLENPLTEEFIRNIARFWEKNQLGTLQVESLNPLSLKVYDCYECQDLPVIGRPVCAFDSGILTALFSSHFNQEMEVFEVKCYAKGDEYCCFEIKPIQYI